VSSTIDEKTIWDLASKRATGKSDTHELGPTKFYAREKEDKGKVPDLSEHGYTLLKRFHMFGWAPTYKHNETNHVLMYYENHLMEIQSVHHDLLVRWRPVNRDERLWYLRGMSKYFSSDQWSN